MSILTSQLSNLFLYTYILFLFFSDFFFLRLNISSYAIVLKDILFLVPIYILFFINISLKEKIKFPNILFIILIYFLIIILNSIISYLQNKDIILTIIGIKSLLFYVPSFFVANKILRSPQDFKFFLKFILIVGSIPLLVGIFQYILILNYGYQEIMFKFYGENYRLVTQNLVSFNYGWFKMFRIPSTFNHSIQFGLFILIMLFLSHISFFVFKNKLWKYISIFVIIISIIGGFTCGLRSLYLYIFLFYLIYFLLSVQLKKNFIYLIFFGLILFFYQNDLFIKEFFRLMILYYNLFVVNFFEIFKLKSLLLGIFNIGELDTAARYALNNQQLLELFKITGDAIEGYFFYFLYSVGLFGLIIFILLMSQIFFRIKRLAKVENKSIYILVQTFLTVVLISLFKTKSINFYPMNFFFWFFLGFFYYSNIFALKSLNKERL
jgi:hypothetical protein